MLKRGAKWSWVSTPRPGRFGPPGKTPESVSIVEEAGWALGRMVRTGVEHSTSLSSAGVLAPTTQLVASRYTAYAVQAAGCYMRDKTCFNIQTSYILPTVFRVTATALRDYSPQQL